MLRFPAEHRFLFNKAPTYCITIPGIRNSAVSVGGLCCAWKICWIIWALPCVVEGGVCLSISLSQCIHREYEGGCQPAVLINTKQKGYHMCRHQHLSDSSCSSRENAYIHRGQKTNSGVTSGSRYVESHWAPHNRDTTSSIFPGAEVKMSSPEHPFFPAVINSKRKKKKNKMLLSQGLKPENKHEEKVQSEEQALYSCSNKVNKNTFNSIFSVSSDNDICKLSKRGQTTRDISHPCWFCANVFRRDGASAEFTHGQRLVDFN